jgi:uncharacterized membrane protein YhfC
MNILYLTYPLSALLIFILVFGLAIFIVRKYKLRWRLFFIGAAGFILSQIFHIPFNVVVLNPLISNQIQPALPEVLGFVVAGLLLGLSAGLFEEFTRYGLYRWWAKDARTWVRGVLLGTGWGGIEAILLAGLPILISYIVMVAVRGADIELNIPPEQIDAYWSIPWYLSFLGFIERALAIVIQISLSVLVLQVFVRRQSRWLWFAICWHTLVDALAVFLLLYWSEYEWMAYAIEGVAAFLAIISLIIIFALKQPEPEPEPMPEPPPEPLDVAKLPQLDETPDRLEDSRYN